MLVDMANIVKESVSRSSGTNSQPKMKSRKW